MIQKEQPGDALTGVPVLQELKDNELALKLISGILAGNIPERIAPQIDFTSELGISYPTIEDYLKIKSPEALTILDYLNNLSILKKEFFDKLLRCPQCHSFHLRPSTHCTKCGSTNISRGRVFEHSVCGYLGLEEDFITKGKYVCPKCQLELRSLSSDYVSLGLRRQCRDCNEVITAPEIRWRCLKCSVISTDEKVDEVYIYSYTLDETKRSWLEFELKPKQQLIDFLKQQGYEVKENASVKGRSGADHRIDILATRDDGVISYDIAIGIEVTGEKIGLDKIFDFDDKVYDIGIHDKMLVVIPNLAGEAQKFAGIQRIKVLEVRDLESVLASSPTKPSKQIERKPFEFTSKSHLIEFLKEQGYEIRENAKMKGKSGAEHTLDILATRDEGIITHHIAIGIKVDQEPVGLDMIFDFDDKTYDIGIQDKVFIAVPGINEEARHFAERQRIRVIRATEI